MMIYLDTHVLVYLYQGDFSQFSPRVTQIIESESCLISGAVALELAYLFESGRIKYPGMTIIEYLSRYIDLSICTLPGSIIALKAMDLSWTRDPFDRLIVANAACEDKPLVTKDRLITQHYPRVIW